MSHAIERLHQKLVHVLIEWDKADAKREAKRGYVNIYRLGHLLGAAQRAQEQAEADGGTKRAYRNALMECFNPSPRILKFIKENLDGGVNYEHGLWRASHDDDFE